MLDLRQECEVLATQDQIPGTVEWCDRCGYSVLFILNLLKHFPWDWKTPSDCYEEAEEAAGLDHIAASTSTIAQRGVRRAAS